MKKLSLTVLLCLIFALMLSACVGNGGEETTDPSTTDAPVITDAPVTADTSVTTEADTEADTAAGDSTSEDTTESEGVDLPIVPV